MNSKGQCAMAVSVSASTCSLIFLRPINRISAETTAAAAIIAARGTADLLLNKPIADEDTAPSPNCIAPSNAEATPAFRENGAMESAEVLGLVIPTQNKVINI